MKIELYDILRKEVNPALGCTGPTSVSFAASVAKDTIGGELLDVKVIMDRDTYKNSISVGIPGTKEKGLDVAAALGAVGGKSALGLEVLRDVGISEEEKALDMIKDGKVIIEVDWSRIGMGLYIEAFVKTTNGEGHAIVVGTHTNVVFIEKNGEVLLNKPFDNNKNAIYQPNHEIGNYRVPDFIEFIREIPIEKLDFIRESVDMNLKLAESGIKNGSGSGFGKAWLEVNKGNLLNKIKAYTAAASDARMAGENLPAMSCASSGNVGITASVSLAMFAEENNLSKENMLRAVALSFLITIYVKNHIGRLSPMCACAIAASLGVAAGTAFLLEETNEKIDSTITNVIGSLGGILCDGAKNGCALKLSMAIGVAIESAYLSKYSASIAQGEGLVQKNADESIRILGKIAREGMREADIVLCKEIIDASK